MPPYHDYLAMTVSKLKVFKYLQSMCRLWAMTKSLVTISLCMHGSFKITYYLVGSLSDLCVLFISRSCVHWNYTLSSLSGRPQSSPPRYGCPNRLCQCWRGRDIIQNVLFYGDFNLLGGVKRGHCWGRPWHGAGGYIWWRGWTQSGRLILLFLNF